MNMYKSESTVSPIEWDLTSSGTTVYHNYNIVEKPANGDKPKVYQYDVDEHTKAEYESVILEQSRADIDYLAIMTGVDL